MSVDTAKQPGRTQSLLSVELVTPLLSIFSFFGGVKLSFKNVFGQVYTGSWGDHDGIIRCKLGEVVHYELGEEPEPRREAPVFDKSTRGTSVEKFREMVFNHLKVKDLSQRGSYKKSKCFSLRWTEG